MKLILKVNILIYSEKDERKYLVNYHIQNQNHEMYLGACNDLDWNSFDNKRKHINNSESNPWTQINVYSTF